MAKRLALEGKHEESDDYIIEAYANAIDLIDSYDSSMFLDKEIEFLESIINEFEKYEE